MEKPYLEITQNNKSGLHGRCSVCEEYFTFGGPGLARDPEAARRTMQRQFDKHVKQVHTCEKAAKFPYEDHPYNEKGVQEEDANCQS
jgi:hypothetical protein